MDQAARDFFSRLEQLDREEDVKRRMIPENFGLNSRLEDVARAADELNATLSKIEKRMTEMLNRIK